MNTIAAANSHTSVSYFSKLKPYKFAIAIILGVGGFIVGAVGLAGYYHVNPINLEQTEAINMMIAGGGVLLIMLILGASNQMRVRKQKQIREQQINKFNEKLCNPSAPSSDVYRKDETCDVIFPAGAPSTRARVILDGGKPTNGAQIDEGMILIQAPHNENQIELMRGIVVQKNCRAVIRVGHVEYYQSYSSDQIGKVPVHVMDTWPDCGIDHIQPLHTFITEVASIPGKGPLLVHCRAGMGRSGTFAICYSLYQKYKEANGKSLEIDPTALVAELRTKRFGCVQGVEQFKMILDYIGYLNKLGGKIKIIPPKE